MDRPNFKQTRQFLSDYKSATPPRGKQEVIKSIRKCGFTEIADNLAKLLADEQEKACTR